MLVSAPLPSSPLRPARVLRRAGAAAFVLAALASARPLGGQTISPDDDRDKARLEALARATEQAGFAAPAVVGRGRGPQEGLFCLLATQSGRGVLVVALEARPEAPIAPLVLETGRDPADLGIGGVRFDAFLGEPDLLEVTVNHRPFQLEVSRAFERRHILRRIGNRLLYAGEFDGDESSSYAKGFRSVTQAVTVSVAKVPGEGRLAFDVRRVRTRTERGGQGAAPVVERQEEVVRYRLDASGRFLRETQPPAR